MGNKFEYKDLNKGRNFVSSPAAASIDSSNFQKEQMISNAVSEHLSNNLDTSSDSSMWGEIKTHKVEQDNVPNIELSEIKTHVFSEDGQNITDVVSSFSLPPKPEINIDKEREEAYQKGYKDAEATFAAKLEEKVIEDKLQNAMLDKLSNLNPNLDMQDEVLKMGVGLISIIAKKLHLAMPADFEAVILGEMMPVVSRYYKKGKVIAKVHPDRVDYCNNLFKIGELPDSLSKNIEIISDETIAKNDCSIEWQDAALEYNQKDLLDESEKILDQLKED